MKIIAIANQKGGVGKTTTSINLAAALAEAGKRILLLDIDPQANATSGLGIEQQEGQSIYPCLIGDSPIHQHIIQTAQENLHLIPTHQELAGAEIELAQRGDHLVRLRQILEPLHHLPPEHAYDYLLLDCPPSLGVLMTSALSAADEILSPLQCEYFSLEGLSKILHIVEQLRSGGINPGLQIEGILLTMHDPRTKLTLSVAQEVQNHFPQALYQTVIPRTIRLGEAPSHGMSILQYEPKGRGAKAYRALAQEFIKRREG